MTQNFGGFFLLVSSIHIVMKKVKIFIEKGKDDYSAYMDNIPLNYSCIGQGATVEDAIEDFRACYNEMRRTFENAGEPFEEVDLEFCYDVPVCQL